MDKPVSAKDPNRDAQDQLVDDPEEERVYNITIKSSSLKKWLILFGKQKNINYLKINTEEKFAPWLFTDKDGKIIYR